MAMELSRRDVFGDTSLLSERKHLPRSEPDFDALAQTRTVRRKIQANPPASVIHDAETGAPWRIEAETKVLEENRVAEREIQEKRVKQLGVQLAAGIRQAYGINVDFALMSTIVRAGFEQGQTSVPIKLQREVKLALCTAKTDEERMEQVNLFLKAAKQYDLPTVLGLLDIALPVEPSPFLPTKK